jgi:prevent-host-death family protein
MAITTYNSYTITDRTYILSGRVTMETLVRSDVLYADAMAKRVLHSAQETRDHLRDVMDEALTGTHTVVMRHGQPTVVVVPMDWYRRVSELDGDPTDL